MVPPAHLGFDAFGTGPYTPVVLRGVAVVVAVAMLSMSGSAALLHVHASAGHEHAEHHHGPAAHSHAPVIHQHHHQHAAAARGDGTEIEPCEPADHIVPLAFTCVAAEQVDVPLPEVVDAVVLTAPMTTAAVAAPSDVRAHSPPRITDAPLRAPPTSPLA